MAAAPPDMISFKAERGCILAVEITANAISFLLTDLRGNELEAHTVSLARKKTTPDAVCGYIHEELRTLLRRRLLKNEQLMALIVGVPAITNVDNGTVLSISTLDGWRSVPLRAKLGKLIHCLIIIENDTNLAALGERYKGGAQGEPTFILIHIGRNVGAGIVLNGELYHGSQWSAGEIAYLRLPKTSRQNPTVHEFGELETVLTSSGILDSWQKEMDKAGKSASLSARKMSALDVLNLAQSGKGVADRIVQHRAAMVADIAINFSLILNPGLILLGGEVGSHPVLVSAVQKQLEKSEFAVTRIAAARLSESGVLWGAVAVALDAIPSVLLPPPDE